MKEIQLDEIPLFAALPPNEMELLQTAVKNCDFHPGEVLFREGEIGDRFSIVLSGEVNVIKAMDTPDERILAVVGPGEFIGEMSLLYRDRIRSASARARTYVRLVEITQADFDALLQRHPVLAFRIMQEMSLRLRNSEDATIRDLQEKNQELARAYIDLQAAQARLIEQEKMEHELRMARKIQEAILPKELPHPEGWRVGAYWQPARAVSGDFYDFIEFSKNELGLVVGDVTDKGVPAALVMATTRSVLRAAAVAAAIHGPVAPGQLLAQVNDLLCADMPPNMFVTCLVAVLELDSGRMRFANAGHDLPYLRRGPDAQELKARGMPLGLMTGMGYEEKEVELLPGDCLLMYSDGLVEAHNPQGEMFGFPRLRQKMTERSAALAGCEDPCCGADLMEYLLQDLKAFTGPGWEQEDDVTLVTLECVK